MTYRCHCQAGLFTVLIFALTVSSQPPIQEKPVEKKSDPTKVPEVVTTNKNTLLKKYKGKVTIKASTFFNGWPATHAIDGEIKTSWFSATGDAAAKGTRPWIEITFPEDVTIKRVTILGNRDPAWFDGYTIISGLTELRNAKGKLIWADENKGVGNRRDFEHRPKKPFQKVRTVRFSSLKDQGDQNPYDDIAIAEIYIE